MKAIILAAGSSSRMYPLTITKPKPMIKIAGKPILEHILLNLVGIISEAIIVVGYHKDQIKDYFKKEYEGIKIIYVEQKKQIGTGDAVLCAKKYISEKEKFLIIPADNYYSKKDIERCVKHDYCVLATEVEHPRNFGILNVDKKGFIKSIEEKPEEPKSNLASTALWVMNKKIIHLMEDKPKTDRNEYEITCALNDLIEKEEIACVKAKEYFKALSYPWEILDLNEHLLLSIEGDLSKNVEIDGKIILGKGSKILPGTYIQGNVLIGKNTVIGPNAQIRGSTSIGDNCRIGQGADIKNCVIGDNTFFVHHGTMGDSVVGDNVNFGAGTTVANLRHDKKTIMCRSNGDLIDTKRIKLGAIIADGVKTGINTSIYPGRRLWPNTTTKPGEIVKKDILF